MSTSYLASTRIGSLKDINTSIVGMVCFFAQSSVPSGWLVCDGTVYSRSQYADLFNAIGVIYGSTSSTNFRVPDLRGCFVRGIDLGKGFDVGRVFGSYQADLFKQHTHTATITLTEHGHPHGITGELIERADHTHTVTTYGFETGCQHNHADTLPQFAVSSTLSYETEAAGGHSHGAGTLATSSEGAHSHPGSTATINDEGTIEETRPKNIATLPCIKF